MNDHGFEDLTPTGSGPQADEAEVVAASEVLTAATHAELAAIVLGAEPLGAVLRRIAELAVQSIPGAGDASVTLIERDRPKTVAFCGELAPTLDERQYEDGYGPCLDAAVTGQTILLDTHDPRAGYQGFAGQARRLGVRHVLAVGMPTLQQTSGALNVYSFAPAEVIDSQVHAAVVSFAGYAAVTLFNAALYAGAVDEVAQMHQAIASRAGIEQAKGIIMARRQCTAEDAFAILVDVSSRTNQKLRDVAQALITEVTFS